jgi:hypothetical protein
MHQIRVSALTPLFLSSDNVDDPDARNNTVPAARSAQEAIAGEAGLCKLPAGLQEMCV